LRGSSAPGCRTTTEGHRCRTDVISWNMGELGLSLIVDAGVYPPSTSGRRASERAFLNSTLSRTP
jgi:hypothetical protein